jgi:predicted nucleic acid-binding protein
LSVADHPAGEGTGPGARGWLLDTNVISELRKGVRGNAAVRAWAETVPPPACFLSRVTVAEIRFGIEQVSDPGFRGDLEAWLREGVRTWFGDRILDVDETVLLTWRRLVWDGQKANYTYSQPDALIAATALVHQLGVASRNVEDFRSAGVLLFDPWTG